MEGPSADRRRAEAAFPGTRLSDGGLPGRLRGHRLRGNRCRRVIDRAPALAEGFGNGERRGHGALSRTGPRGGAAATGSVPSRAPFLRRRCGALSL